MATVFLLLLVSFTSLNQVFCVVTWESVSGDSNTVFRQLYFFSIYIYSSIFLIFLFLITWFWLWQGLSMHKIVIAKEQCSYLVLQFPYCSPSNSYFWFLCFGFGFFWWVLTLFQNAIKLWHFAEAGSNTFENSLNVLLTDCISMSVLAT